MEHRPRNLLHAPRTRIRAVGITNRLGCLRGNQFAAPGCMDFLFVIKEESCRQTTSAVARDGRDPFVQTYKYDSLNRIDDSN